MKKLYLLLANGLVLFAGVGTLTLSVAGCDHKKKDGTTTKIYDALNKFTKTSPLEIPYQTKTPTAKVSDSAITKAVKELMKAKVPAIFTDTVLGKIKFDDTPLKVGEAVAVKATYNNDQEKAVTIYIKEPENFDQVVYDALKDFNDKNPIVIPYNKTNPTAPASDPVITGSIQAQLKFKNPIFTSTVVAEITFSNTPLQENKAVQVQATYKEQATPIYVLEEDNSLSTLVINILKKYNASNPVIIGAEYAGKFADEKSHDGPAWSIRTRIWLKFPDKIKKIIPSTWRELKFDHTQLKKGESVRVIASYGGKSATIFVRVK